MQSRYILYRQTLSKDPGWSSYIRIERSGGAAALVKTSISKIPLFPASSGKQSAPKNSKWPCA